MALRWPWRTAMVVLAILPLGVGDWSGAVAAVVAFLSAEVVFDAASAGS